MTFNIVFTVFKPYKYLTFNIKIDVDINKYPSPHQLGPGAIRISKLF